MKVARLTATRIHQRLRMVLAFRVRALSVLNPWPVPSPCTTFLYDVHEILASVTRTAYSCQL